MTSRPSDGGGAAGSGHGAFEESGSDREIVLSRVFAAPRAMVWRAFTDPEQVPRWWGPRGFTTTTEQMDLRPGGQWRFVMHGPDGQDYKNLITYLEVAPLERLRYKHGGELDLEPVNFEVMVTFESVGAAADRTRLTLRMMFESAGDKDRVVRDYGAIEGGKQTLTRLGEHLDAGQSSGGSAAGVGPFVVSRVVRAPREVVFKLWTEREHLMKWFGPKSWTIPECTLDLRPGGAFHYCMRAGAAGEMWGKWVFREITPPERLVFVSSFSDPAGAVARGPFDSNWPLETLSTVTFAPHAGKGRGTLVTIECAAISLSEAEQRTFDAGHDSMRGGWAGTLDRLEEAAGDLSP